MPRRAACRRFLTAALSALAFTLPYAAATPEATDGPERLHEEPQVILMRVARQMNVELRADEPPPHVFLESRTPLAQFQDAVEAQWKHRPARFANVYVVARNEIYLSDDPAYYRRMRRTLDESLAHEFTHYVQARYLGYDLADESCEAQALDVQMALRRQPAQLIAAVSAAQGRP